MIDDDLESRRGIQRSLLPEGNPSIANLRWPGVLTPEPERIRRRHFPISSAGTRTRWGFTCWILRHGGAGGVDLGWRDYQFLADPRGLLGGGCQLATPRGRAHHLNDRFRSNRFDSYLSIVCVSIDIRRGVLTYGSAGHPPRCCCAPGGTWRTLDYRGPVIVSVQKCRTGQKGASPGARDKIILYTTVSGKTANRRGRPFAESDLRHAA